MKVLKIEINAPADRKELFIRMCELLSLEIEKEVKALSIGSKGKFGYNVTIPILMDFFSRNKVRGEFDFENKSLVVYCEVVPGKGKKVIDNPEIIKNTSVDEDEEDISLPGAPDGSESLTPLGHEFEPEKDEEDDPF